MSALPSPRPRPGRKLSKKQAARAIARLLEEHMGEIGLSEEEKNARTTAFTATVKKLKILRADTPTKRS
jgi:hypothetical protein